MTTILEYIKQNEWQIKGVRYSPTPTEWEYIASQFKSIEEIDFDKISRWIDNLGYYGIMLESDA